jgi:hypothetical protein
MTSMTPDLLRLRFQLRFRVIPWPHLALRPLVLPCRFRRLGLSQPLTRQPSTPQTR